MHFFSFGLCGIFCRYGQFVPEHMIVVAFRIANRTGRIDGIRRFGIVDLAVVNLRMFGGSNHTKLDDFFHARPAACKSFFVIHKYTAFYAIPDIITEYSNIVKPVSILFYRSFWFGQWWSTGCPSFAVQ